MEQEFGLGGRKTFGEDRHDRPLTRTIPGKNHVCRKDRPGQPVAAQHRIVRRVDAPDLPPGHGPAIERKRQILNDIGLRQIGRHHPRIGSHGAPFAPRRHECCGNSLCLLGQTHPQPIPVRSGDTRPRRTRKPVSKPDTTPLNMIFRARPKEHSFGRITELPLR
jgi:hypothetical protein